MYVRNELNAAVSQRRNRVISSSNVKYDLPNFGLSPYCKPFGLLHRVPASSAVDCWRDMLAATPRTYRFTEILVGL